MVEIRQGGGRRGEGGGGEEEGEETDIKSNNPHLTGGEYELPPLMVSVPTEGGFPFLTLVVCAWAIFLHHKNGWKAT